MPSLTPPRHIPTLRKRDAPIPWGVDVKGSFVSDVTELTAADINALILISLFAVESSHPKCGGLQYDKIPYLFVLEQSKYR
jgi:hypothetical protein